MVHYFNHFFIYTICFVPIFINPYLYIPFILYVIVFIIIKNILPKTKELQNYNSITLSYVFNHFETIGDGLIVIRSQKQSENILQQGCQLIDKHISVLLQTLVLPVYVK